MLEGHAIQKFHGDEGAPAFFADIVDGANVGMVQSGSGFSFAAETFQGLAVLGNVGRQKLECDKAVEPGVFGFVDNAHTAATQFLDDAVVRNALTDHGRSQNLNVPC